VDYVAMDFKHTPEKYGSVSGVQVDMSKFLESVKILLESNIDYEFRTTVIDGHHTIHDIEEIAKIISGARHYYLQNYKAGKTLEPNFRGRSFLSRDLLLLKKAAQKYVRNVQIRM
jgi:pyruvate formate lyase activating enzyme